MRERECLCVFERGRDNVCIYVCVCEREGNSVREFVFLIPFEIWLVITVESEALLGF